ncbi:MAG TPA: hypothetical protein VGK94_03285 [Candidatus Polarisedimenticolia bacterium]
MHSTVPRRTLAACAAIVLGLLVLGPAPAAWAQIDPPAGSCNPSSPDACPQNDNLCTIERCNPETLRCESVPVVCADDNACTVDSCNPSTGQCVHDGATCADDNPCTVDSCSPSTGECTHTGVACADDNPCTVDSCNPSTGGCTHEGVECDQDDNLCTIERCNPASGECDHSLPVECPQDDNRCTVESCVPSTGECESGSPKPCEEDRDPCTTVACKPSTGECSPETTNPPPDECDAATCRTPGFWGTHAGTEKSGSRNITQAVINAVGSLSVCGETISTTIVNDDASAVEAICVSPSATIRLQLARQLTAAALNCVASDGDADCSSTPLFASAFASCNAVCANSSSSTALVTSCIGQIDCLNNGGRLLANGYCQTGVCAGSGSPCKVGAACLDTSACLPLPGNCHDQLLDGDGDSSLNFEPTGAAGSSTACNSANKTACTAVGSTQSKCLY